MAKQYKTKRLGKTIDLEAIKAKFGDTVAVGNMSVNARGDVLGKGGEIIQKASERVKKDYSHSDRAIKRVNIKKQLDEDKKLSEKEEAERKRKLAEKEVKLRRDLQEKKQTESGSKKTTKKKASKKEEEKLKPTDDPNVFEKIEENGDIILVNKDGKPIPTPETLDDPDGGLDDN